MSLIIIFRFDTKMNFAVFLILVLSVCSSNASQIDRNEEFGLPKHVDSKRDCYLGDIPSKFIIDQYCHDANFSRIPTLETENPFRSVKHGTTCTLESDRHLFLVECQDSKWITLVNGDASMETDSDYESNDTEIIVAPNVLRIDDNGASTSNAGSQYNNIPNSSSSDRDTVNQNDQQDRALGKNRSDTDGRASSFIYAISTDSDDTTDIESNQIWDSAPPPDSEDRPNGGNSKRVPTGRTTENGEQSEAVWQPNYIPPPDSESETDELNDTNAADAAPYSEGSRQTAPIIETSVTKPEGLRPWHIAALAIGGFLILGCLGELVWCLVSRHRTKIRAHQKSVAIEAISIQ
eukprot:849588_1